MTMMHLKYPAKPGFYSWDELGCLSRALGFQADMFKWKISETGTPVDSVSGLSTKEIMKLVDSKYFDLIVDKTLNGHSADWNLCVMKKALTLVERHILSFEDLHQIRAAYQAYEAQDLKGLELDEKTLLRCIKMCGRVIAPLKMQHRIKHMSQTFDEEGRIQLYEFLDLILWCELSSKFKLPRQEGYQKRKKTDELFEIPDFHKIIMHNDERLNHYLNDRYLKEEWDFGKETYAKRKLPKEPPVNRDFRLEQIKEDKSRYRVLKSAVTQSQRRVYNAQAGYVRPRPISAPAIDEYDKSDKSSMHTAHSQRPVTVHDLVKDFFASSAALSSSPRGHYQDFNVERSESLAHDVPHSAVVPAVTQGDLDQTAADIEDLKFQMTTLELKYRQNLLEDMKYFVPGRRLGFHRKNDEPTPKPALSAEDEARRAAQAKAAEIAESSSRMAYAPYRPPPSPAHGAVCDARFRGWRDVSVRSGQHYVLTSATYERSPTGSMLAKLNERAQTEVRNVRGDYATRYTRRGDVAAPDTLRPATAPPSTASSGGGAQRSSAEHSGKRSTVAGSPVGGRGVAADGRIRRAAASSAGSRRKGGASAARSGATAPHTPTISKQQRANGGGGDSSAAVASAAAADPAKALSQYARSLLTADAAARASASGAARAELMASLRLSSGGGGGLSREASARPVAAAAAAVGSRVSFVDDRDRDAGDVAKVFASPNGPQQAPASGGAAPSATEHQSTEVAAENGGDGGEVQYDWKDFNIYKQSDEEEETGKPRERRPPPLLLLQPATAAIAGGGAGGQQTPTTGHWRRLRRASGAVGKFRKVGRSTPANGGGDIGHAERASSRPAKPTLATVS